jgi:hypothetical protein
VSDWLYNCKDAESQLVTFVQLLARAEVLASPPDESLLRHCVHRCASCNQQRGVRRCTGWRVLVERGVLSFRPFVIPGHDAVRIDLSGDVSFQRPKPAKVDLWEARPLASSTVTVEIVDQKDEHLLERHHYDLANPGQLGPTWHLQYGGNPQGCVADLPTSWLKPPRWAAPPMDLALLAESIVYNFYPTEWDKLNTDGAWVNLILGVERLVISHFARHMHEHFDRAESLRDRTWLTAQDNSLEALNPRPG